MRLLPSFQVKKVNVVVTIIYLIKFIWIQLHTMCKNRWNPRKKVIIVLFSSSWLFLFPPALVLFFFKKKSQFDLAARKWRAHLDDCFEFTIRSFVPGFILTSKLRLGTQPFKNKMNFIHYVILANLHSSPCPISLSVIFLWLFFSWLITLRPVMCISQFLHLQLLLNFSRNTINFLFLRPLVK